MSKLQAKCKSCATVVSTSDPGLAGKSAKCPKCGGSVRFPMADDEAAEDNSRVKSRPTDEGDDDDSPSRKRRREHDDDGDVSERSTRKKKTKGKAKGKRPLGLIIGGGVALVLVAGVIIFLLTRGSNLRGEAEV